VAVANRLRPEAEKSGRGVAVADGREFGVLFSAAEMFQE
jgi:hypothetical protein